MADEIVLSYGLSVTKDNLKLTVPSETKRLDLAGSLYASGVQEIGTTYEAIDIPAGLSTAGYAVLQNLDATNFIEVGVEVSTAFVSLIKLDPGQVAILPLSTLDIFAQADTDPASLQYTILER